MNNILKKIKTFYLNNKKKIIWFSILGCIVFLMLFSDFGYLTTIEYHIKKNELQDKINISKKKNDSLKKRIEIITNDSMEIERIAREHYGLIKQNEEIYIVR